MHASEQPSFLALADAILLSSQQFLKQYCDLWLLGLRTSCFLNPITLLILVLTPPPGYLSPLS